MRPEHLDLLHSVGRPSLTPDGRHAVIAVAWPDTDIDRYRSELWATPTDGTGGRRLTVGHADTAPRLAPDGRRVAFLRSIDGGAPQIHVTAIDGGEPMCLTDQPAGAGPPQWSPDGTRLAWSARTPEPGRYGTEDDEGNEHEPKAEPPRLITEFRYRLDNLGYLRDRRRHVFVADVPDGASRPGAASPELPVHVRQLTDGDADDGDPVWSPDGRLIAFVSSRHESRETDLRAAVHLVRADLEEADDAPPPVTAGDVSVNGLAWLPDGRVAVLANQVGPTGIDFVGRPGRLFVSERTVSPEGGSVGLRAVTGDDPLDLDGDSDALIVAGDTLLVRDLDRGRARLLRVDPDASPDTAPDVVLDGLVISGHAATSDGRTIVVSAGDGRRSGDLAVVRDGAAEWLTDVSARLRSDGGITEPRDIVATGADGYDVHGWIVLPDSEAHGDGPYPVLLCIHGGPFAQYTAGVFDEAQVYAGAGYAVAMCNPRGSAGYGLDHGRSIAHAMGTVDADDVIAFLDHTLADDDLRLDAERVGVMGGSYGGYMTALLTTRTDRFAAAIVERGYLDANSFVGSSDIGWFFPEQYHGSRASAAEQSPMTHVDRVTTPTLVIHSETDWRTPIEQGQRWFTELKLRGVHAELLIFPAESHELSRSGRPRHRRQRFEHILRWWAEYLPTGG